MSRPNQHFYFNPSAAGAAVFLGPTEARLMELAWKLQRLTVKNALFHLGPESGLAYTTVMTVLNRLTVKKLLKREKVGRVYEYTPCTSRKEFISERVAMVTSCLRRNF